MWEEERAENEKALVRDGDGEHTTSEGWKGQEKKRKKKKKMEWKSSGKGRKEKI